MEEYIRLVKEKACRRRKLFNWENATYGKICDNEDVHNLKSIETKFPAIVFNDKVSSETLSCKPTISSLNNDEIDFRISFDESDDEDYAIYGKKSFSYKIISVNDLKSNLKNDNDKVDMPSFLSPEPTDNDDDKVDIEHSSRDLSVKPLPDVIYTDVGAYAQRMITLTSNRNQKIIEAKPTLTLGVLHKPYA
nr:hypothetical protein [Tanacetum cinerariifolium]